MSEKIRCLLIAPLTQGQGFSGEDAYTQSLLAHPPEGVEYVFYDDLVASGKAQHIPWVHTLFFWLSKERLGILPYNWIQTLKTDEDFDIVHIHGWAVKLVGKITQLPLVISASSAPTYGLYAYKNWSDAKVRHYVFLARWFQRVFRIYDSLFLPGPAKAILVWSKFAYEDYRRWGISSGLLYVVPPGLPAPQMMASPGTSKNLRILFVGNDFKRKGGFLLLEVFRQLQKRFGGNLQLTIVSNTFHTKYLQPGILHIEHANYVEMEKLYQTNDVLVLPSQAEGYGMCVVEAMSFGVPVIVSDAGALPELVQDRAGFVFRANDAERLYSILSKLADDPQLCKEMGYYAREQFVQRFSIDTTNVILRSVYNQILARGIAQ